MTQEEFMRLPFESRKRIEEKIVDLDRAIQNEYGFSILATEMHLANLRARTKPDQSDKKESKDNG